MTKSETDPLIARNKSETTVAEMDLSLMIKKNSKSKIKEHTISSNKLDKELHDAHILNTLRNRSKIINKPNPIRN